MEGYPAMLLSEFFGGIPRFKNSLNTTYCHNKFLETKVLSHSSDFYRDHQLASPGFGKECLAFLPCVYSGFEGPKYFFHKFRLCMETLHIAQIQ